MSGREIEIHSVPRLWQYLDAHLLSAGYTRLNQIWRLVFAAAFLFYSSYELLHGRMLLGAAIFALGVYLLFRVETTLIWRYYTQPALRVPQQITLSDTGVEVVTGEQHRKLPWDYFQRIFENRRILLLMVGRSGSVIIPQGALAKEAMESLKTLIHEKMDSFPSLISAEGLMLHREAGERNIQLIDASWYLPAENRNPQQEYQDRHITGAVYFDIDTIKDSNTSLPHMLPSAEQFAAAVGAMGISNEDAVVVYDTAGIFSAARVWWMFRYFGHKDVAVLDGGLPAWIKAGGAVSAVPTKPEPVQYQATAHPQRVRDMQQMISNLATRNEQVVDARSSARFSGKEAEPRAGIRSGHIPQAKNVHYKAVLNEDGTMKSPQELRAAFTQSGVMLESPLVASCGSGVTAAILILALDRLGKKDIALYDGSWAQWGASDQPISTEN